MNAQNIWLCGYIPTSNSSAVGFSVIFSPCQSFFLLKCFLVLFRFNSLLSLWNTHLPVKNFVALTRHIDVCFPFSGCIRPSTVQHGSTNLTDTNRSLFPVGTVLQYSCDPGYLPVGRSVLTCTTLGYWSSEPPRCIHSDGKDFSDCSWMRSTVQEMQYTHPFTSYFTFCCFVLFDSERWWIPFFSMQRSFLHLP